MKPLAISIVLATSLLSSAVFAEEPGISYAPSAEGDRLVVSQADEKVAEIGMPCRPAQIYRVDKHLVATCEKKPGLLFVDLTEPAAPRPIEVRAYGGNLERVYRLGDELWVDVKGVGSRPIQFEEADPVEPRIAEEPDEEPKPEEPEAEPEHDESDSKAEKPEPPKRERELAEIIGRRDHDVIIDMGSTFGIEKGDRVEFVQIRKTEIGGTRVVEEKTVGEGRVESVSEESSIVRIGLNVRVPEDARVRPTGEAFKVGFWGPPRTNGQTEISLTVRPFLPLGSLGGGAIMDIGAMHRFEGPIALAAVVSPLGFAITNNGNAGVFAAHGILSYDTRIFQVGLGAGVARFQNDNLPFELQAGADEPNTTVFGVSGAQYVRLGPRDGLNLTATTNFVVRNEEFDFGGLSAEFLVPIGMFLDNSWLVFRGGAGLPGHGFGEVGLRTLVKGTGTSGSLFVTPTLGGANIATKDYEECDRGFTGTTANRCLQTKDYGGPMVGITLEWRP